MQLCLPTEQLCASIMHMTQENSFPLHHSPSLPKQSQTSSRREPGPIIIFERRVTALRPARYAGVPADQTTLCQHYAHDTGELCFATPPAQPSKTKSNEPAASCTSRMVHDAEATALAARCCSRKLHVPLNDVRRALHKCPQSYF